LAKDGNADYLITGDVDLLVMKEFEQTKIVTLSEFETLNRNP
jgi:predicted nucleic acid-binding protein